jgi:hypothetical protein
MLTTQASKSLVWTRFIFVAAVDDRMTALFLGDDDVAHSSL